MSVVSVHQWMTEGHLGRVYIYFPDRHQSGLTNQDQGAGIEVGGGKAEQRKCRSNKVSKAHSRSWASQACWSALYYIILRPPKWPNKLTTSQQEMKEKKPKRKPNKTTKTKQSVEEKMRKKCKVAWGAGSMRMWMCHGQRDQNRTESRFKPKNANCLVINKKNGSHFGNRANSFGPHFMSEQRVVGFVALLGNFYPELKPLKRLRSYATDRHWGFSIHVVSPEKWGNITPSTHSFQILSCSWIHAQFNGISGKEKHARRELHTHVDINPCRKGPHIRESKGSSLRWKTQPTLLLLIQIFQRQVFLFVPPIRYDTCKVIKYLRFQGL